MLLNLLYILTGGAIVVAIILLIAFFYKKNSIHINSVKAGPTHSHVLPNKTYKTTISPFEYFYHNGKKVNPKDYIVCTVEGDCMSPRGINAGDIIFIKAFKHFQEKKEIIKKGDIVYIKYNEGYKIREVNEKLDNNTIKTLYYRAEEGTVKESSLPHELQNVIGIVEMNFKN